MRDITAAVVDQELVEEFLTEASGVHSLTIDYADSVGQYDVLMDTWQHEHQKPA